MPEQAAHQPVPDVRLLLRVDAEQCWLHREVIPVLSELEATGRLAGEDAGAALAYLEAMWSEATIRARATDAAHGELRCAGTTAAGNLRGLAGRYHAAVRVLRELTAARVDALVQSSTAAATQDLLAESPGEGGCAPRAA